MRKHPSRSHIGLAIAALVLLTTVMSGCGETRTETDGYGWKASSHDATTLTVIVVTGGNDTDVRATVVSESDTAVVIDCSYRRGGGSGTANGAFHDVDVQLAASIGEREVRNQDGTAIPEQKGS